MGLLTNCRGDACVARRRFFGTLAMAASAGSLLRAAPLLIAALLFAGCSTTSGLAKDLSDAGAKRETTSMLVFTGTDTTFGTDVVVPLTDPAIIDAVWGIFEASRPISHEFRSAWNRIEVYGPPPSDVPLAVIFVNATDECYVSGSTRHGYDLRKMQTTDLYKCDGLSELMTDYLKPENERLHGKPRY